MYLITCVLPLKHVITYAYKNTFSIAPKCVDEKAEDEHTGGASNPVGKYVRNTITRKKTVLRMRNKYVPTCVLYF